MSVGSFLLKSLALPTEAKIPVWTLLWSICLLRRHYSPFLKMSTLIPLVPRHIIRWQDIIFIIFIANSSDVSGFEVHMVEGFLLIIIITKSYGSTNILEKSDITSIFFPILKVSLLKYPLRII